MENINSFLIESFKVYKNNKDYEKHKIRLEELSKYRLNNTINMGSMLLPNIGPDEKIKDFYKELKDWSINDVIEVKYMIKLYSGENIENIQEAITIMDVLMHGNENYKSILNPIKKCLIENKEINYDDLVALLNHENLLLSNLFTFFVEL